MYKGCCSGKRRVSREIEFIAQTECTETRKLVQRKPHFNDWRHCSNHRFDDKVEVEVVRITKIEKVSMGVGRYYTVEYKKSKRVFSTVRRTAQSLCVVMRKDEQEGPVIDPILFLNEADLASASKKHRVIVKLAEKENAILDIGSAKGTQWNDIGKYRWHGV